MNHITKIMVTDHIKDLKRMNENLTDDLARIGAELDQAIFRGKSIIADLEATRESIKKAIGK